MTAAVAARAPKTTRMTTEKTCAASSLASAWLTLDGCVQDTPVLERRGSFTVLPPDKLTLKQDALVKQTADLLYVEPAEAGVLLRHFGWKEEKVKKEWFADTNKVRRATMIDQSIVLAQSRLRACEAPPMS